MTNPTWIVTGAAGQLGSVIASQLQQADAELHAMASPRSGSILPGSIRLDLLDTDAIAAWVRRVKPHIIVHAAAVTDVAAAHDDPNRARATNAGATRHLLELASEWKSRLILLSTDLVFDGSAAPYTEESPCAPLSVYGRTKVEAEDAVNGYERGLILRPPLMYGLPAVPRNTTFIRQVRALLSNDPLKLFVDEFRTPIALHDAAAAVIQSSASEATGTMHIGGPERLSRFDMGRIMARAFGRSTANVREARQSDLAFAEPRPPDVSLSSRRFEALFGQPPGRPMQDVMKEIAREWDHYGQLI